MVAPTLWKAFPVSVMNSVDIQASNHLFFTSLLPWLISILDHLLTTRNCKPVVEITQPVRFEYLENNIWIYVSHLFINVAEGDIANKIQLNYK